MNASFPLRPPLADPGARPEPEDVPIVWPTGQQPQQPAEHGYAPETARDHLRIRPQIAAFAIAAYTRPGDTVLDPDCGAGTTLVEAVRAGRHAIGLASGRRWWNTARANLTAARRHHDARQSPPTDGMVLDQTTPPGQLAAAGAVDLILTSWRHPTAPQRPTTAQPSDRRTPTGANRLAELLTRCRPLLAPDGHVVVIARPRRREGYLLNGPAQITAAARTAKLALVARCVALVAPLNDEDVRVEMSIAQRAAIARLQRITGHPIAATAHHDVWVFRAPHACANASALRNADAPELLGRPTSESATELAETAA
ncbi:DNA methyltransferase [Streptomyces sp. NPDC127098]|uniref:DNA methyltransferase n=1 Tax=Streptomyces sp. NPDC127098 TaxID=3347137 RepID=UPI0036695C19